MVLSSCRNTGSPIATKANRGTPVENGRNLGLHSAMAVSQTASALDFTASHHHRRHCFPTWVQCMKMSSETTPGTQKEIFRFESKLQLHGSEGTVKTTLFFNWSHFGSFYKSISLSKIPGFAPATFPMHHRDKCSACNCGCCKSRSATTTSVDVNMTWGFPK